MEENKKTLTPQEQRDEQMISEAFQRLLDTYLSSGHRGKKDIIIKAFNFAKQAHKGVRRLSGEPYILHPIAVAQIVCQEIGLGSTSICAALLHDVEEDTDYTNEDISNLFGPKVANIVEGLTKIAGGIFGDRASLQAETFKKLLLTMSDDIRVILIKIADRLHNMRTLSSMLPSKQYKISGETLYIYAPIADRLGLNRIKTELEDLSFKYEHPAEYQELEEKLAKTQDERDKIFNEFTPPICTELDKMGIKYTIKARVKSPYSIWNKMQKKHIPFEEVFDVFAIRIVFVPKKREEEINECFNIYVALSKIYKSHPDRFRDWLNHPKANGYQALHVTLMSHTGQWIEVQIRSDHMDDVAEQGYAAHWKYKNQAGYDGDSELNVWLNSIKEILDDPQPDTLDFLDAIKLNLFASEILVFTPKGEIKTMPANSTVLDFAFHIHSKLGCKCIGAKVNGKNVQLKQKLNSGDQVEIMTSNTQTPKQDWLNIVTTSKARTKIRQALKEMVARQHDFAKETLERKFKNRKLEYDEATMMRLIKRLGFKNVTEFYQKIADGALDVNEILDKYVEQQKRDNDTRDEIIYRSAEGYNLQAAQEETTSKEDVLVIDQNLKGLEFKLAKCCNPIYGDDVFGFVTVSGGIKIHRADCPNANQMRERFGYRIVKARWAGKSEGTQYPITLRVVGHDDIGIVTNITSIISKENGITLRSIGIDSNDGLFSGTLTVMVGDTGRLEALIKKLRTIKGVKQVSRN
mgnify:CR=1 FL=1